MSKLIVFEGHDETIVGDLASVDKLVQDWFIDGQRVIDDYEVYWVHGDDGLAMTSEMKINDIGRVETDITAVLSGELIEILIEDGSMSEA